MRKLRKIGAVDQEGNVLTSRSYLLSLAAISRPAGTSGLQHRRRTRTHGALIERQLLWWDAYGSRKSSAGPTFKENGIRRAVPGQPRLVRDFPDLSRDDKAASPYL